ncbi:MAG: DASS family sodium-coupled anion symporter [Ignavibacteriales bacterium]|nr:DASS family sodium-coupled anion symporter [Ignavibacteriales bacterium]
MTSKTIGLILGALCFILILVLPTFETFLSSSEQFILQHQLNISASQLAGSMQAVFALLALMVIWWITEAIPLPATALLPAVLLPLFHIIGVQGTTITEFTFKNVLLNYSNPVIFLFLGGFLIAAAMQKWKLDQRLTLWMLTRGSLANNSHLIVLGMMAVTAFLSMWISNTATAAMMLPLGLGILSLMGLRPGESRFGTALMLGIAWAASIGGVGTIIGTPPNGIALGILNTTFATDPSYHRITFLDWMAFGIPYVIIFIPVAWFILLKLHPPEITTVSGGKEKLLSERAALGPMNIGEQLTIVMFLFAVVLWISNPFWDFLLPSSLAIRLSWIDEYAIGLLVGTLLFIIPVDIKKGVFVLDWRDTKFVDWGTLILFGGGIALSDAMFKTGLASWIATSFVALLGTPSTLAMMFAVVFLIDFLTEVTSNTAVTSMIVPVVISIAVRTGENPITLSIAAAIAASMAFMLPVATPPNALVYATGYIRLKDMVKAGFVLDIVGWLLTVGILIVFGSWIFGVIKF